MIFKSHDGKRAFLVGDKFYSTNNENNDSLKFDMSGLDNFDKPVAVCSNIARDEVIALRDHLNKILGE